ncbi:MAG TPA: hypothetical protein ENN61_00865 [Bacteroidaceae bacterium]|nr:hypothetical protein [Bacteroidaceae bacterium]
MNKLEQGSKKSKTRGSSYAPPIVIIVCSLLIGVFTKSIAKMLAQLFDLGEGGMGLNARANIEGVLATIAVIGLIIGIGYIIKMFYTRKNPEKAKN